MGLEEVKILCTICARGGSKGVKGKNLRLVLGKPLIAHTIKTAIDSQIFTDIAISSDSSEILDSGIRNGGTLAIKRPDDLADDYSGKLSAIKHCLLESEKMVGHAYDMIVDLDVTAPLRIKRDIIDAVNLIKLPNTANVITGCPARRSPYFNLVEKLDGDYVKLSKTLDSDCLRRQDSPECFDMNASIYVWTRDSLLSSDSVIGSQTRILEMPEDRSVDIDTEFDLEVVTLLMERVQNA